MEDSGELAREATGGGDGPRRVHDPQALLRRQGRRGDVPGDFLDLRGEPHKIADTLEVFGKKQEELFPRFGRKSEELLRNQKNFIKYTLFRF